MKKTTKVGSKKKAKRMTPTRIVHDETKHQDEQMEEKKHHPFEQWMVDSLFFLMENRQVLNDWERSFVSDRAGAFDKYGFNAVITDKQIVILHKIHKRVRFSAVFKQMESEK